MAEHDDNPDLPPEDAASDDTPEKPDGDDRRLSAEDLEGTIDTPSRGNTGTVGKTSELGETTQRILDDTSHTGPKGHPGTIGNYKIVRVIGEGGMGTTYEAVQATPRRRVAVKVIRAARFTEQALKRFEYEAQILARLTHPGIAQIYEAGMWTDEEGCERPFMAMEFIDGSSLTSFVKRADLSSDDKLRLFQKICDAVQYSHQRGVIHRDLKPDNILIRKDGTPKVIDFGVARVTDSDLHYVTQQTNMGQLIGTLQYMSPEQVEYDTTALDTRSDVYALGVILYELLCGALPYNLRERALHEAVRVICEDQPENPSTFHKYLRGDVETITLKALEKNRNRRYGSAEDLSSDIRRYLENDPIEARPPNLPYRLSKFCRKHKATAIAAAAVVLAITAGGITSALGWAEASWQKELVVARNEQLDQSINGLLNGVMGQVKYLGNSAQAQRKLLDLAGSNVEAMAEGATETPFRQAQLAVVLMRIGKSHLNTSGVGYGSLDEAEAVLEQVGALFESIDIAGLEPSAASAVQNMRVDRIKLLAELERNRADVTSDDAERRAHLTNAATHYRARIQAGKDLAAADSASIKAVDIQMSSQQGLGNVLFLLDDSAGARSAFEAALSHAQHLETVDVDRRTRRMRDRAIALRALALTDVQAEPTRARNRIEDAIKVARALVALEPDNVRRPRDLANMLALRGRVLVVHAIDVDSGVENYRESVDLFTTRAVESPRETASQQDLESTLQELATVLGDAGRAAVARTIIDGTITQLQCVAEAEDRAGNPVWIEILTRLEGRAQDLASTKSAAE